MTRPRYVLRSGASISSTANSFSAAFSREITPRGSLFVATSGANLCIFCALVDGSLEPIISFTETAQFGHVEPLYDEDYYAVTWALDDRAPHGRSTAAAAASPPVITTTARGRVSINLSAAAAAGVGAGAGASVGEGSRRAAQLVVAGGRGGVVTVVDACTGQLRCRLLGHGRDVNHVVTHPLHEWLVLSGSKDETIRMWDVSGTGAALAVFAGNGGHKFDVLSLSIHPAGLAFASSGMDNTLRVWALDTPAITTIMSRKTPVRANHDVPIVISTPLFATRAVHGDYADAIAWVGNVLVSKCAGAAEENKLVAWVPSLSPWSVAATAHSVNLPGALPYTGVVAPGRWPLGLSPTLPTPGAAIAQVGANDDGDVSILREFLMPKGDDFWFTKLDVFVTASKSGGTAAAPLPARPPTIACTALGRVFLFALESAIVPAALRVTGYGGGGGATPRVAVADMATVAAPEVRAECPWPSEADAIAKVLENAEARRLAMEMRRSEGVGAGAGEEAVAVRGDGDVVPPDPEHATPAPTPPFATLHLPPVHVVGKGGVKKLSKDLARAVAFSADGRTLIVTTQGGNIWRFDDANFEKP